MVWARQALCCFPSSVTPDGQKKAKPEKFGAWSTVKLTLTHPGILTKGAILHPIKLLALMRKVEVQPVNRLCAAVPSATLGNVLGTIVKELSCQRVSSVLVPLLNAEEVQGSLVALLSVLDASCITQVLNGVPAEKLALILKAPPEALTALVTGVQRGRFSSILIPVLGEPKEVLAGTLVPLVAHVEDPKRIAQVVNQAELEVVLRLLRGVDAMQLVVLMDALDPCDFEPNGAVTLLLQAMADERGLTRDKVIPLLQKGDAATMAQLVEQVSARQLLEVLRRVEVDGVLRLLENTNIELVVRLFNGPMEAAVSHVAGSLADAVKNPRVAMTVRQVTDALNDGFLVAERKMQVVRNAVKKVQEDRGLDGDDPRHLGGTLTREFVDAVDKHKVKLSDALAHTREESAAFFRDISDAVRRTAHVQEDSHGHTHCTVDEEELIPQAASAEDASPPRREAGREVPLCLLGGDFQRAAGLTQASIGSLAAGGGRGGDRSMNQTLADAVGRSKAELADAVGRSKEVLAEAWLRGKQHLDSVLPGADLRGRREEGRGQTNASPEPDAGESRDDPQEATISLGALPGDALTGEEVGKEDLLRQQEDQDVEAAWWGSHGAAKTELRAGSPEGSGRSEDSEGMRSCRESDDRATFEWQASLHRLPRADAFDGTISVASETDQDAMGCSGDVLAETDGRLKSESTNLWGRQKLPPAF